MKLEGIKSIVLTILVCISIFFTWNIWTYQPHFSEIPSKQFVENNPLSNVTKKIYEVIFPEQLLVQHNGEYYGTYDEELLSKLWKEMRKWELTEFRNISNRIEKNHGFDHWLNGRHDNDSFMTFAFSDTIPITALATVTDWAEKDSISMEFDRIIIPFSNNASTQSIYFVDVQSQYVVQAEVATALSETWKVVFESAKNDFNRFVVWEDRFYLPEESLKMVGEQYITKLLRGEQFKNALFSNPSYVKKDVSGSEFVYTDSARQLVIDQAQAKVLYVNPTIDQSLTSEKGKLLLQSIDFVNSHGGWISGYNDYKYFSTDQEQKVYFRLTVNNFPVFAFTDSHYTITSIIQSWGNSDIALYQRPLFYLDDFIREEKVNLPKASEVIAAIERDASLKVEEIERIFPAYDIQVSTRQDIIYLQPVWALELTNGKYHMLNMDQSKLGGEADGLE
ncbi:two-component system activity regulator YycH [Bacillus sp. FJAT-47783]|uniref:YycH family regulatory protein n=1 Tax=Bacillus sp. FJAT-47783 TaxID=2922712 RepID=UPI001FAD237E|nr:two-component system activity regulator YycH [Bacillus sp. FJAT-47783]